MEKYSKNKQKKKRKKLKIIQNQNVKSFWKLTTKYFQYHNTFQITDNE